MHSGRSHLSETTTNNRVHLPPIESLLTKKTGETPATSVLNESPQESAHYLANHDEQIFINNNMHVANDHTFFPVETPTNQAGHNGSPMEANAELRSSAQKTIPIKSQPRPTHHPRTLKEKSKVRNIIHSEKGSTDTHPSIYIFSNWQNESADNLIEVALVDIQGVPHPYPIENVDDPSLIDIRCPDNPHALYYRLTQDNFGSSSKSFKVAIVKSKQDSINVTRELVHSRKLEKSMLRFRRFFLADNGYYHPDKESTAYTHAMTEKYGNISVKHVSSRFGPMGGGHLLDVVFTACTLADKTKLAFQICAEEHRWTHPIPEFDSTGGTIHFWMPPCPVSKKDAVMAKIVVCYQGQQIYEAPYLYHAGFDSILDTYGMKSLLAADANSTALSEIDEDLTSAPSSSSKTSTKSSSQRQLKRLKN